MTERLAQIPRHLLAVALAALPPLVLIVMNNVTWRNVDFDTILLTYGVAIYVGLLMALVSLYLSLQQFRRGGFQILPAVAVTVATGFVVWVAPNAYSGLAAIVSRAFGAA